MRELNATEMCKVEGGLDPFALLAPYALLVPWGLTLPYGLIAVLFIGFI